MIWSVHPDRAVTMVWNTISRAIFSPDSRLVAAGIGENKVVAWNVATLEVQAVFAGAHDAVAFSPDGRTLMTRGTNYFLRTFDVATQTARETIPGQPMKGTFFYDALSPDGHMLAAGLSDGTLTFFDARSGAALATNPHAYASNIFKITFSRGGNLLATAGIPGELDEPAAKIWDVIEKKRG